MQITEEYVSELLAKVGANPNDKELRSEYESACQSLEHYYRQIKPDAKRIRHIEPPNPGDSSHAIPHPKVERGDPL